MANSGKARLPLLDEEKLFIIRGLEDEPNEKDGLSADELKAKFDEAGLVIRQYINEELIPAVLAADATEKDRLTAEAARTAAEEGRGQAEEQRQVAEAARAAAEEARGQAEERRETAEAQRAAESQAAIQAARDAAVNGPYVEENGHWMVWDGTMGTYQDTGVSAKGDQGASRYGARVVVGTATAGWTTDGCDYLCDGTADEVEINAAINALPAAGGEVVILDGTYELTGSVRVNKDNVTLRGNGPATKLVCGEAGAPTVYITGKNCTARDMQARSNGGYAVRVTGDYAAIMDCLLYASNMANGTLDLMGKGGRVMGNLCRGPRGDISLDGAGNVAVGNVFIHDATRTEIPVDAATWSSFIRCAGAYHELWSGSAFTFSPYNDAVVMDNLLLRLDSAGTMITANQLFCGNPDGNDLLIETMTAICNASNGGDYIDQRSYALIKEPSWYQFQYALIHRRDLKVLPDDDICRDECEEKWEWKYKTNVDSDVNKKEKMVDAAVWRDFIQSAGAYHELWDANAFTFSPLNDVVVKNMLLLRGDNAGTVITASQLFCGNPDGNDLIMKTMLAIYNASNGKDYIDQGSYAMIKAPTWYQFQYALIHRDSLSSLPDDAMCKAECESKWSWKYEQEASGTEDNVALPDDKEM